MRLPVDVVRSVAAAEERLDQEHRQYFAAIVDVAVRGVTGELVKTLLDPTHACCPLAMIGEPSGSTAADIRAGGIVRCVTRRVAPDDLASIVRETICDTLRYRARLHGSANTGSASDALRGWLVDVCGATPKEVEVAELVRCGLRVADIASARSISESAAKQRLTRLQDRCSVGSKLELQHMLLELFGTGDLIAARPLRVTSSRKLSASA